MSLARHTQANREFFEKGRAPTVHTWLDWIRRGVVKGKVIDGRPWVDLNHFAARQELAEPPKATGRVTGLDLLSTGKAA